MPEPDSDSPYAIFFFVPAWLAILPLCEPKFKYMSAKGSVDC